MPPGWWKKERKMCKNKQAHGERQEQLIETLHEEEREARLGMWRRLHSASTVRVTLVRRSWDV